MFGIPGEVFWPTVAIGVLVVLVFGGVALLRLVPARKSRSVTQVEREELEQLQERVSQLEERLDFAERVLAQQRDAERLGPPKD